MSTLTRIISAGMGFYGIYLSITHQITLFQIGILVSVFVVDLSIIGYKHE